MIIVELHPSGRRLEVTPGSSLQDLLFEAGVEFPCGGRGRCKGCRVRCLEGELAETVDDVRLLSDAERAAGYRLACQARPTRSVRLELAQWEAAILSDHGRFEFQPRPGVGVAVDVGTTTVVAQLVDLETGEVLAVQAGWNAQARHGADIMSRVEYGSLAEGRMELARLVRDQVGSMIGALLGAHPGRGRDLCQVSLVGNTVMHHLFGALDVTPLGHIPFHSDRLGPLRFTPAELAWAVPAGTMIEFIPCIGGFVGSDVLAGVAATHLAAAAEPSALVDLGTNGEIVVAAQGRMLCASTAAGPAFEGARIGMGMRASAGAISQVEVIDGRLNCRVIGGGAPRGICGSGLVDAVAGAVELGLVQASGRITAGDRLDLRAPVALSQADIRELQLAKGAIAAGLRTLVERLGLVIGDLRRVYLAGAFGNYINRQSAQRIGLLPLPSDRAEPAGNTALLGAKLSLFRRDGGGSAEGSWEALARRVEHVALSTDEGFHERYLECMALRG